MKAAFYEALGAAKDVLKVGEVETPTPGPGEVLVRLAASGVNPSDWKGRRHGRGGGMGFPRIIPHSDGAGTVAAVGAGVEDLKEGARVWVHNGQWQSAFGTAAEFIALDRACVAELPDGVDFATAACFGIPFLTAHRAVTIDGDIPGQTVLVAGGAGGVGHYIVQIAKDKGARVITTVSSAAKAAHVRDAGADEVIDYRAEDLAERVADLTDGKGVDRIFELNLSANGPLYDRILAPGGTAIVYGTDEPMASIPAMAFIRRGAVLKWFIVYQLPLEQRAAGIADLNRMLAKGKLKTAIARTFPLDDIVAAHEMVEARQHIGNVVVEVG